MDKQSVIDFFANGEGRAAGIRRLADALKIEREAIYQWGDTVPLLRAYQIERLTDGELKVAEKV